MLKAFVDPNKCLRCDKCHASRTCPVGAIFRIDKKEASIVESKLCHGCGDCMVGCPAKAVILKNS